MKWTLLAGLVVTSGCAVAFAQERAQEAPPQRAAERSSLLGGLLARDDKTKEDAKSEKKELGPGETVLEREVDGFERTFIVYVPKSYDKSKPIPLVLAFHGLGLPASMMPSYSQLNVAADKHHFVVVYPAGIALSWNAGARKGPFAEGRADDVKFTREILDELEKSLNIDKRRVYATGMSNGGMMCYRLANELSDRIAAIAPVSGTMTYTDITSKRAVPIIHFHGTDDELVPFADGREALAGMLVIRSAPDSIAAWVKFDGCKSEGVETKLPDKEADETTVTKTEYSGGRDGSEVILYTITGGGHQWPGVKPPPIGGRMLGKTTYDISANDLIWEFFEKHPMPEKPEKTPEKKDAPKEEGKEV